MRTFFFARRMIARLFVGTETGMVGDNVCRDGGVMGMLGIQLVNSSQNLDIAVSYLWCIVAGIFLIAHKSKFNA